MLQSKLEGYKWDTLYNTITFNYLHIVTRLYTFNLHMQLCLYACVCVMYLGLCLCQPQNIAPCLKLLIAKEIVKNEISGALLIFSRGMDQCLEYPYLND